MARKKTVSTLVKQIENAGIPVEAWRVRDYITRYGHTRKEAFEHFTSGQYKPRFASPLERSVNKALKSTDINKKEFAEAFSNSLEYKKTINAYREGKRMTQRGIENIKSDLDFIASYTDSKNQDIKQRLIKSYRIHLRDYMNDRAFNAIVDRIEGASYYEFAKMDINELFSRLQQLGNSDEIVFDKPSEGMLKFAFEEIGLNYFDYRDDIDLD